VVADRSAGTGFEFVDAIKGGVVRASTSRREKGSRSVKAAYWPATGHVVTLRSYHEVDSKRTRSRCRSIGFKDGMRAASPTLLEPIMRGSRDARGEDGHG